jgi:hypothetical protein
MSLRQSLDCWSVDPSTVPGLRKSIPHLFFHKIVVISRCFQIFRLLWGSPLALGPVTRQPIDILLFALCRHKTSESNTLHHSYKSTLDYLEGVQWFCFQKINYPSTTIDPSTLYYF